MSFDTLDDVANRLDKLEILHQDLFKEYQYLLETTDEMACRVGKELGELAVESKAQKSAMEDIRHRIFYGDTQRSQLAHTFEAHRDQTYRILRMQERLQEASMMNARTTEQMQISSMLVHLMDKVNKLMARQSDIQSISDSEDTIGIAERAIRRQHLHDKVAAGKQAKKGVAKSRTRVSLEKDKNAGTMVKRRISRLDAKPVGRMAVSTSTLDRKRVEPQKEKVSTRRWNRLALGSGCFDGSL